MHSILSQERQGIRWATMRDNCTGYCLQPNSYCASGGPHNRTTVSVLVALQMQRC